MTDQKLSQLTNITSLADTDELYVNDGGTSKAVEFSALRDEVRDNGNSLAVSGNDIQSFTFVIRNDGGVLKHQFYAIGGAGIASNFTSRISGATASATTTPTGPDASTAMAGGGKVSGTNTYSFVFDTEDQVAGNMLGSVNLAFNNTGSNLFVRLYGWSQDINGTTRRRPSLDFYDAGTGGTWPLNTTNIPSGNQIWVNCLMFIG